jgi:hypothetical protein
MKKSTKTQNSGLIREVTAAELPRVLPFIGLAVRKHGHRIEVYMKTAPRRKWKLQLNGLIAQLPMMLPR